MTELHDRPPEPSSEADLFIDFANTVEITAGVEHDHLSDSAALHDWLRTRDLAARSAQSAVARELDAFRHVRDLVREITARRAEGRAPTATQLRRLNDVLREGAHHHVLRLDAEGGSFTVGQAGEELAQARAAIAGSLAHYLADHDAERLRVCADDGCRWLFVDRSPTGRRRWCDMRTCGNRAKVARHRARQRTSASG